MYSHIRLNIGLLQIFESLSLFTLLYRWGFCCFNRLTRLAIETFDNFNNKK
jgi:hypothetical protein